MQARSFQPSPSAPNSFRKWYCAARSGSDVSAFLHHKRRTRDWPWIMGKRRYRKPHWWFDTRLEHTSSGSLGHMFICLPTRQKGVTVSNRTLTLNRLVHPVVPPHVDYSLTPAGHKFAEAVTLLCEWAVQNKALLKQVVGRGTH